jgi:hypothetical protein
VAEITARYQMRWGRTILVVTTGVMIGLVVGWALAPSADHGVVTSCVVVGIVGPIVFWLVGATYEVRLCTDRTLQIRGLLRRRSVAVAEIRRVTNSAGALRMEFSNGSCEVGGFSGQPLVLAIARMEPNLRIPSLQVSATRISRDRHRLRRWRIGSHKRSDARFVRGSSPLSDRTTVQRAVLAIWTILIGSALWGLLAVVFGGSGGGGG